MTKDTRTDEQKAKDCIRTLGQLQQIRQPYEYMVDQILTYINHGRRKINESKTRKGQSTGIEIYDGTAPQSLNIAADAFAGYSASRSSKWFEYSLPNRMRVRRTSGMRSWDGKRLDEYPDVKRWLESYEEVMDAAFMASNFYDVFPQVISDALSVGTVTVLIEENLDTRKIIFTQPHFRECFIAENASGMVDTNYRLFNYDLRQMVQKFGKDVCKEVFEDFDNRYNNNPYELVEIIHAIQPRTDFDPSAKNGKNKPVSSIWVLKDKTKLLLESGYSDMPAITWRWRKNNDEWYGRSPAWDAYVEVMTANQAGHSNLVAAHKMVDPPMVAPADLRGKVNNTPRGWTWLPNNKNTKDNVPLPLVTGIQLPFSLEMQERFDKKIREHFHVDFFLMLSQQALQSGPELRVIQIMEMQAEKAAILGPRVQRMETELFDPLHDRVSEIEHRAGRTPDPPQILVDYAGESWEVDYTGRLSQMQKRISKAQGITAGLEALAGVSQIFPEVADIIDPDKTAKDLLESYGFPARDLRDDQVVEQIRKMRQAAQDQAQAAATAIEGAKALPAAGKAIEEGSPLALLTEGGPAG